ncbi:Transcription antitermination factor NusG [Pedobacter terrae]|uniref:Transcription antitermination factor NusG n=1 Tax=Pedobacter terrae TaxID=405671 RepID=A0A1G8EK12_9SPHI|nr:transcription termination/antitermination NusG family protein [Pedobacter terrae]SDH70191.1 Transcription antitermination factor NusG [Pedobacter terrae]
MAKEFFKFSSGWYLLYCRPKQEKQIANRLSYRSVETFVPEIKKRDKGNRRSRSSIMFPSYVFVHLSDMSDYYEAQDTTSVVGYVKFNNIPVAVDEETISSLKTIISVNASCVITTEKFNTGAQYEISGGLLSGLKCEIIRHMGSHKGLVRVLLLDRNILIDIPSSDLLQYSSNL